MKTSLRLSFVLAVIGLCSMNPARADVIYSGYQNIAIPNNFGGVYLNVETGQNSTTTFSGYQINAVFGGAGIGNTSTFQPARVGTANNDFVVRLNMGDTISGALNYSTGNGGSQNGHLGNGSNQFFPGTEGFLGFKTNGNYGWMGAVLSANQGGNLVDWAYENGGGTIAAGNIRQAAPSGGASLWTLTANGSEAPTLGSVIANGAGNSYISSVVKNGTGTWALAATNTYTGTTNVNAGALLVNGNNSAATGAVTVTGAGTVLGGSGTVGGPVTLVSGATLRGGTGAVASGALTLANAVNTSAGIIELALGAAGAHSSLITTNGTWTFGAGQVFSFIDLGAAPGFYDNIISGLSVAPNTDPMNWTNANGWAGTFMYDNAGGIDFTLTAVPEPATWAAGLLTVIAFAYTQRRRFFKNRSSNADSPRA